MVNCVYCNSTENLNTSFNIAINDEKVSVAICDDCSEEATIKTAREAYSKKQTEIEEILKKAKELGLDLSQTSSGLTIATAAQPKLETPTVPLAEVAETPKVDLNLDDPDVVSTTVVDAASSKGMVSTGGNAGGQMIDSLSSHSMNEVRQQLGEEATKGYAKMAMVEGREGHQLAIPQKRVDGMGTTRISIRKTEDDRSLQERTKRMAQDENVDFRGGYSNASRVCPFCNGDMEISGKECPKCKGAGFITLH